QLDAVGKECRIGRAAHAAAVGVNGEIDQVPRSRGRGHLPEVDDSRRRRAPLAPTYVRTSITRLSMMESATWTRSPLQPFTHSSLPGASAYPPPPPMLPCMAH